MTDTPTTIEEAWTCMGWRLGKNEAKFQTWLRPNGKESWWPKRGLVSHADAGHVYAVTIEPTPDDGVSVFIKGSRGPRYKRYETSERVTEWSLLSEAAESRASQIAAGKNAAKQSELKRILEPLREAYSKAPRDQRRALLAAIITEVTWGSIA